MAGFRFKTEASLVPKKGNQDWSASVVSTASLIDSHCDSIGVNSRIHLYDMDAMGTPGTVGCCLCGVPTAPNPVNMCVGCIATQIDVSEDIQKGTTILNCQSCGRYFNPPKQWIQAPPESRELLRYCLKKIKGLSKVKLVDAEFVWTEPHSKRIKLRLTVQKEFNGAVVQGNCQVTFIVQNNMCSDCNRRQTNDNVWTACVQVRQHVPHKRTFFYLEQLILKHKAHEQATNMKSLHEGVDFYFGTKANAQKFVDFLQSVVPIRSRHDRSLVSHDTKSNHYNYKYAFSVEIAPICKDDVVCLPPKVGHHHGGIGPLVVCCRVSHALQFIDPITLKSFNMDGTTYWRHGFKGLRSSRQLVSYVVLDIESMGTVHGRYTLAEATVIRESDLGKSDQTYSINTHLGNLLKPGDVALGYDLLNANLADDDLEAYLHRGYQLPDVVLIKKSYERIRKRRQKKGKGHEWKMDRLEMDVDEQQDDRDEQDRERFLQEIEEDGDLRAQLPVVSSRPDGESSAIMDTSSDEDIEDTLH